MRFQILKVACNAAILFVIKKFSWKVAQNLNISVKRVEKGKVSVKEVLSQPQSEQ